MLSKTEAPSPNTPTRRCLAFPPGATDECRDEEESKGPSRVHSNRCRPFAFASSTRPRCFSQLQKTYLDMENRAGNLKRGHGSMSGDGGLAKKKERVMMALLATLGAREGKEKNDMEMALALLTADMITTKKKN
ncbi:unnamed protein product, partial [Laminaria digitata]